MPEFPTILFTTLIAGALGLTICNPSITPDMSGHDAEIVVEMQRVSQRGSSRNDLARKLFLGSCDCSGIRLAGLRQAIRLLERDKSGYDCRAQFCLFSYRDKLHMKRIPHAKNEQAAVLVDFSEADNITLISSLATYDKNAVARETKMMHAICLDLAGTVIEVLELECVAPVSLGERYVLPRMSLFVFLNASSQGGPKLRHKQ
jgi:hypothetical protein